MQFAHPHNLFAALVLVPMLLAFIGYWWWRRRLMERIGDAHVLIQMAANSPRRQVARAVLGISGTALLCIALAQPQWGRTDRPIHRTGVDIVFALDLSQSMIAQDVPPSRLQAAKDEIETALEVLRGDRVGLVVFTAISFVQSPLTVDYGAIRFYLERLRTEQMPLSGTSLGRAVTDGVELLTGERVRGDEGSDIEMRRAESQIIVLITDGEDHESDPLAAAELARERGIKIVTVGIGSRDGGRIPVFNAAGKLTGYKRDQSGEVVRTHLDEETLEQIADTTGGTYIRYSGPNSVVHGIVDYVNELEKSEIETLMKERHRERFSFFLAPGLVLLILSLLIGERGRRRDRRATSTIAALFVILLVTPGCERPLEDTHRLVDEGNHRLERGDFEGALEQYREAEEELGARPELQFDIGRALLGLQRFDEAADAFARALESADPVLQFDALYNLGLALAGKEDWHGAWESFRDALVSAARSGGIDAERLERARHNLDVAWRRWYPPCGALEDPHEENDEPGAATRLDQPSVEDATLCGLDDDWYVVGAIPGTKVSVTASFRDLREEPDPELPFLPRPADVQIALFDANGQQALVIDQGAPTEEIADRTFARTIDRFAVEETMVSAERPFLLLNVKAAEHLEFKYDLNIQSIPPCHALEEEGEDNDGPADATLLQAGGHDLHSCPADDDWFAVDLVEGDSLFVDLTMQPDAERESPPRLTFELYGPDELLLATAEEEGIYHTAGVRDVRDAGRYRVHVFGKTRDEQGPYRLDVYRYGAECSLHDDRFEENDGPATAATLQPQQPVQRYLRACEQDADFFRVDFAEDDEERSLGIGLAHVSTPRPDADPTDRPIFEIDAVSAAGDQIVVPGESVEPHGDEEEPPIPLAKILQAEGLEGPSAFIRVAGHDDFYHLVQLDEPPSQNDEQSSENDERQQNESETTEPSPDGESGDEQEQTDDQSSGEETDQPSEGEKKAPQSRPEEESQESQAEEGEEAEAPQPSDEQHEALEMQRIEALLEALEQTDDNFQMRKALENMPERFIEKDW